jgi:hypothetical protein
MSACATPKPIAASWRIEMDEEEYLPSILFII